MEQKKMPVLLWLAVLCLYIACFVSTRAYVVLGAAAVVLIICICFRGGKFSISFEGLYLYAILFCLYCYFSAVWAGDGSVAINRGNSMVTIVVMLIVMRIVYNESGYFYSMLKLIMWGNYAVLAYAVMRYGWNTFIEVLQDGGRITNDFLNSNTLGMCAAYAVVINVFLIMYERIRITDLVIVPAVFVLAASGSRKALIILAAGVLAVAVFKNYSNKKFMRSLFRIAISVLIIVLILVLLSRIEAFDNIFSRVGDLFTFYRTGTTSNESIWVRSQYNQLGMQLFRQYPFLGIGLENSRLYALEFFGKYHYFHDNYVELLACTGIFGTAIYYSVYAYILFILIRCHRQRDAVWDICFILLAIRLVLDFGSVTYYSKGTYMYLLLYWLELQRLKHNFGQQMVKEESSGDKLQEM